MTLNIRQKLLLLLLISVSLSVILVGIALSYLSQRLYEQDAQARFSDARGVLVWRLEEMRKAARIRAQTVARRQDVISAVNMISAYQSRVDYQPIIFDGEKKHLAQELAQELGGVSWGTDQREIAIIAADREIVSFSRSAGSGSQTGFVSYENGEPVTMVFDSASAEWSRLPEPDVPCNVELTTKTESGYRQCGGRLMFEAVAPIERAYPSGVRKRVGWVVVTEVIATALAKEITKETGTAFAVLLNGTLLPGTLGEIAIDAELGDISAPLLQKGVTAQEWIEIENYFLQALSLPVRPPDRVRLLLGIPKGPVVAQIRSTRMVVMFVLILSAAIVVPVGILVSRQSITRPLQRLVDEVKAIEQGHYRPISLHNAQDEMGQLAISINDMALTIRSREAELRESRSSLAEAQRIAKLGNWEWDSATGQWRCSDEIHEIFGAESMEGTLSYVHPEDRARMEELLISARQRGVPYSTDYRIVCADGTVQTVHEQVEVNRDGSGAIHLLGTTQVVTELKRVERELRKVNRALKTLSGCNEILVRAVTEQELLHDVSRVLVDVGRYRLAWVGFAANDEGRTVIPVASAGEESDYLDHVHISWADVPQGQGPTGTAVRTGVPQIMNDILHDARYEPWREQAVRRGYASSIAFPLCSERGEVFGALNLYASEAFAFDDDEIALLRELAGDLGYGITILRVRDEHQRMEKERVLNLERMHRSMQSTIQALAATIEKRDPYTAGHQRRVSELATAIAKEMGLSDEVIKGVGLGGIVHDIGKVTIPSEILTKPGRLTTVEFGFIKTHPQAGYEILKDVEFPWPLAQMVLQHHERLDGSGYPLGLKGDDILLQARILSVADVVESMASHRPYRPSLGMESALAEIGTHRGTLYDPVVVDAFVSLVQEKGFSLS